MTVKTAKTAKKKKQPVKPRVKKTASASVAAPVATPTPEPTPAPILLKQRFDVTYYRKADYDLVAKNGGKLNFRRSIISAYSLEEAQTEASALDRVVVKVTQRPQRVTPFRRINFTTEKYLADKTLGCGITFETEATPCRVSKKRVEEAASALFPDPQESYDNPLDEPREPGSNDPDVQESISLLDVEPARSYPTDFPALPPATTPAVIRQSPEPLPPSASFQYGGESIPTKRRFSFFGFLFGRRKA